eukprot:scaffold54980_cov45-Attheya_sp.AAC.2
MLIDSGVACNSSSSAYIEAVAASAPSPHSILVGTRDPVIEDPNPSSQSWSAASFAGPVDAVVLATGMADERNEPSDYNLFSSDNELEEPEEASFEEPEEPTIETNISVALPETSPTFNPFQSEASIEFNPLSSAMTLPVEATPYSGFAEPQNKTDLFLPGGTSGLFTYTIPRNLSFEADTIQLPVIVKAILVFFQRNANQPT